MLIIVYRATKSQGKFRKISPVIFLSAEEYRNPCSLQGKDMLLTLFFLLYALICILILLLRTSRHRTSVQFTCVFNTQNTTFSGFIFVSRKLLYFEAQESVVLRFQPVCFAVRSIPHKLLYPPQSSVTVPESRTVSHFSAAKLYFPPIGSLWRCAASLRIACAKCHIPKGK